MYVSIRDDTLLACGFERIDEGLRFFGLDAVELAVSRELSMHALVPTDEGTSVMLHSPEDMAHLKRSMTDSGLRISAFQLNNDFNAADVDSEIAWIVRVVEAAAELGVPALRIDGAMTDQEALYFSQR